MDLAGIGIFRSIADFEDVHTGSLAHAHFFSDPALQGR